MPGSPDWNVRADLAARAMRLISDGVVERDGVPGLATRLGYSERHLNRVLTAELGAGPLALARAHRAHTARLLIETTPLGMADVAFAAGFASVRQFNDTVRAVYGVAPTTLRAEAGRREARRRSAGTLVLRLPFRPPFDAEGLMQFFAARAVAGVETLGRRRLRAHAAAPARRGDGRAALRRHPRGRWAAGRAIARAGATSRPRCGWPIRATSGPPWPGCGACSTSTPTRSPSTSCWAPIPALATAVEEVPGIRLPGSVDGAETAIRTLLGQQVSVAAARTAAARLAAALGERLPPALAVAGRRPAVPDARGDRRARRRGADRACPADRERAAASPRRSPTARSRSTPGATPRTCAPSSSRCPASGPWTAGYLAMRVLGDPDELLAEDLGVRRGAAALGLPSDIPGLTARAAAWRPWRSYAATHLWRRA